MEITPELKADLKKVVWDYNVDEALLVDIFLGKTRTYSLNREKLCSRLLVSVPWYRLLDLLGVSGMKEILSEEVMQQIWIKDVREKFIYAQHVLQNQS